jgi:hypothetical protein
MLNSSEAFESNFDLYQRVADKNLSWQKVLLDFLVSRFPTSAPFSDL